MEEYTRVAHQSVNGKYLPVEKWENKDTIRYIIVGKLVDMNKKTPTKYLLKLESLAGIAFTEVNTPKEADITMFFGELNDYFRYMNIDIPLNIPDNFDNWNNRRKNANRQLIRASFCVDPAKTKTPERCRYIIRKGILKSLGFWGESSDPSSIFYKDNTTENQNPNKNDMKIIKFHYSGNIKVGMTALETSEILYDKIDMEAVLKEKL